jgi:membrane associated rhomboid family serine protease
MLPIRTNIRPTQTPYTNYALIIANVVAFLLTYGPHYEVLGGHLIPVPVHKWVEHFMLTPANPHLWQFISYAFLHGGFLHIIGNMFFLYIFGNNVNDKIGHIGYLIFYLAGAIFSGIGHAVIHSSSEIGTLGASGAIAAVTGAYLVLFPQTLITVLYWFFFIGTIDIPALYFIGLKMILLDNVIDRYTPNVAYDAHLAGYAYGIVATLILLSTGVLSSSNFDLWAMIKRRNRQRQYSDVVSNGNDPFTGLRKRKSIKVKEVDSAASRPWSNGQARLGGQAGQQEEKITELRKDIANRMLQRNLPAAAKAYLELMKLDSNQVLHRQYLLDIANQLASDNMPAQAAQAYEQFITHYSNFEYIEQVKLMLGILYSRYLHQRELAVKHLQAAVEKLTDPGQLKMCKDELAKLVTGKL